MSQQTALTTNEQKLNDAWEEHLRAECNAHSADEDRQDGSEPARQSGASDDRQRWQGRAARVLRQIFLAPDPARDGDGAGVADHRPGEATVKCLTKRQMQI